MQITTTVTSVICLCAGNALILSSVFSLWLPEMKFEIDVWAIFNKLTLKIAAFADLDVINSNSGSVILPTSNCWYIKPNRIHLKTRTFDSFDVKIAQIVTFLTTLRHKLIWPLPHSFNDGALMLLVCFLFTFAALYFNKIVTNTYSNLWYGCVQWDLCKLPFAIFRWDVPLK